MTLKSIPALIGLLFSVQALAASFLPAESMEIATSYKLELAPDCQKVLLTEDQHRVLREALALHKKEVQDPAQTDFKLSMSYKLKIKGTAHSIDISETEKKILEVLLSSDEPIRHLSVRAADDQIQALNKRAQKSFKRQLIDFSDDHYSIHRTTELPNLEAPAESSVTQIPSDIQLTAKQKILVEAVHNAKDKLLSYEEIGFVMAWTTGDLPRKTGEYVGDINRESLIKTGLPLLKTVRGKGVEVASASTKSLSKVGQIVNTQLGAISLTGTALHVANVINFKTNPKSDSEFLTVDGKAFEKIGLPEKDLIKALAQINKQAKQRFGKPLFNIVDIIISGYKIQYSWWDKSDELKNRTGWNRNTNSGPRWTII